MADLTPCPCGSGLRVQRCCGADFNALSPADSLVLLDPLVTQAELALRADDGVAAQAILAQILELAPGHEAALCLLYQLCHQRGDHDAAELLIRRVVALNPNQFWATNELALLLLGKNILAEAEIYARNAVRLAPQNPQAHNLMGLVFTEQNRPLVGEYHYRQVLALAGDEPPITLANLAWNLKTQGRIAESRALYQRSVARAPDILQTWLGYAKMEEADRQLNRALDLLDEAEARFPNHMQLRLTRATVLTRLKQCEAALALLEQPGSGAELTPVDLSEKGRLLDQMGRHKEAFACFAQAKENALAQGGPDYKQAEAADMATRLTHFFTPRRLAALPVAKTRQDVAQPVFIVGFPRSGTTLVEQSLSAHPQIEAGDELPFITDLTEIMPRLLGSPLAYPEALAELWMGDQREGLDDLRDAYLARARKAGLLREGAAFFTDKMPLNEMHLGFISLLFPQAPIIHVLRHPLDVVLSVYSNFLTHGYYCAASLESIATHYLLMADVVAHYQQTLSMRYITVRYEDIVADQEVQISRLLSFIGVEFDPRCLAFEQNQRYARTASYAQVTERLYDRSCYRYRSYLEPLAPVVEQLRPVIERLGYVL